MSGGPVYAQRPSKDVTRRMFVNLLHRLHRVADLSQYQYVGFGALEFLDFDMVHRDFGITSMVSIEHNVTALQRYEANKPYQCIDLLGGRSSDILSRIKWDELSIVWLDYEDPLNEMVLSDVAYLCSKLTPGSVLAVTLNAEPGALSDRRERFVANVGEARIPQKADDDTLGQWGWAEAQQKILFSLLRSRLGSRPVPATWKQVLNINYRDTARMQLVAGVIVGPGLQATVESCGFDTLEYFRGGPEPLLIEVPYLTPQEQRHVRQGLPRRPGQEAIALPGVPREVIERYESHYQWIG